MKIYDIGLYNFKAFGSSPNGEEIVVSLGGKSTVFYGENGSGKSTLLAAASYALWPFINKLNISQGKDFQSMTADLLHVGKRSKNQCEVMLSLYDNGQLFYLEKGIQVKSNGATIPLNKNSSNLKQLIEHFNQKYLADEDDSAGQSNCSENMPVFLNYGTNRSVLDVPLRIRNNHSFSKRAALERALERSLDFRTFFMWYRNQEDIENEQKSTSYEDKLLKCVRTAIKNMMDDVEEIKVRRSPLRMAIIKNGSELRVEQLSDGEKCTLALLGDIARRVAMANPCRDNPLLGDGVVMIDEIDLHLHPAWQRKILNVLQNTFPNIQFIVTTHSPQVLGEVGDDYNVFKLHRDDLGNAAITEAYTYGKDSNAILKQEMDTSERTQSVLEKFRCFYEVLEAKHYDAAQKILDDLVESIGEDPELVGMKIQLDMDQI